MTPAPETGRTAEEMRALVDKARDRAKHEASYRIETPDGRVRYEGGEPGKTLYGQLANAIAHLRAENANLRDRVREAEGAGRDPDGSGYSGFAPSPMVSASGEYPSRGQTGMIRHLTEQFWGHEWEAMTPAARCYARNQMTDALRKTGFGLVALGIEARQGRDEGSACESPSALGGMPDPLSPEHQEAGDHEPR